MTKTIPEIDDEMVDRAEAAFVRNFRDPKIAFTTMDVRGLLEAALTEPEIEVTEAVLKAGLDEYYQGWDDIEEALPTIYRAMVKAAPGGAKDARQGVAGAAPEKATGGGGETRQSEYDGKWFHCRGGENIGGGWPLYREHRRSTDPK